MIPHFNISRCGQTEEQHEALSGPKINHRTRVWNSSMKNSPCFCVQRRLVAELKPGPSINYVIIGNDHTLITNLYPERERGSAKRAGPKPFIVYSVA